MADFTADCGTKEVKTIEVMLADYGVKHKRVLFEDHEKKARKLLEDTMDDISFINDGCRNEDAVNSCIALHVLGYWPEEWFENFFADEEKVGMETFFSTDVDTFMEHVERMCKYVEKWGPEGQEHLALDYAL